MAAAFRALDSNHDNGIDEEELHTGLVQLGLNIDRKIFKDVFKSLDKNGKGSIDYYTFVEMMFKQEAHRSKTVEPRYIKSFATIRKAISPTPGILGKELEPVTSTRKSPR